MHLYKEVCMPTARILVVGLFVVIIAILSGIVQDVRDAQAIPAFARKYDFACNVCHVPSFPKLNDFGNLFRDHGYQLGTDQELPTYERSEEHTSELQSQSNLVCRLLLEKKKKIKI